MSGIQVSGLLSNSAFDWKSIVDQLIEVSRTPITKLSKEKDVNDLKATALSSLKSTMLELQDAVQTMRADDIFAARTVSSDATSTTWKSSSVTGAAMGSYTFAVTQLATQATLRGASDIGSGLAATTDVSALTIASMPVATAVTAGTFTVAGKQLTVATTDTLQDVFNAISTATGGAVTGSYNPATDKISLTQASGDLVLGAGNDTSNFLAVMKLANNGSATATSSAALGAAIPSAKLASAGLRTAITAVDGSGNGSFSINGVSVSYNVNTDTLYSVIANINNAGAGVTASFDPSNDRLVLTNKATGDVGIAVNEAAGGLLGALGLTAASGGTLVHGNNAQFTVNGGAVLSSTSNTLDATVHGIAGLSVTVNTKTTQALQVESDTIAMQTALDTFITKFNAVQDNIEEATKVTVSGTKVSSAVLSGNREVEGWAKQLRALAFDAVGGATGDISRLDHIGIDFESLTGHLRVKDSGKLATALGDKPEEVDSLFLNSSDGVVTRMYTYLTKAMSADSSQVSNFAAANSDIDDQIATLTARLEQERETLTNAFIRMLDAQSVAQSQGTYLTNTFFKSSSG